MITQEELKEYISYDPVTGIFIWKKFPGGRVKREEAGYLNVSITGKRYWCINFKKETFLAHRLAFFYMTGKFPEEEVDHINGNGLDNSWGNLREVTKGENAKNQRKRRDNKSGCVGVHWVNRDKSWRAIIMVDGRSVYLGSFKDINDAILARKSASIKHGFHENHGK